MPASAASLALSHLHLPSLNSQLGQWQWDRGAASTIRLEQDQAHISGARHLHFSDQVPFH